MKYDMGKIGSSYGCLAVISEAAGKKGRGKYVSCRCSCGRVHDYSVYRLETGVHYKCRVCMLGSTQEHREFDECLETYTYSSWFGMVSRCTDKDYVAYPNYGGRGITVCDRWRKFNNFFDDMGRRPRGLSIDRIDNDDGYSKGNCRWATRNEQARNKRSNVLTEALVRVGRYLNDDIGMSCSDVSQIVGCSDTAMKAALLYKTWSDVLPEYGKSSRRG